MAVLTARPTASSILELTVTYDRDEWRRPWRRGDEPALEGGDAAPDASATSPGPLELRTGSAPDGGSRGSGASGDEQDGHSRSADGAAGLGAAGVGAAGVGAAGVGAAGVGASGAAAAGPAITRFPQPPPAGWDAAASGPGSPSGSVRPPDTTGTVDVSPAPKQRGAAGTLVIALVGAVIGTAATLAVVGVGAGYAPAAPSAVSEDTDAAAPTPGPVSAPSIEPLSESAIVPAVAEAVTPSVVRIDVTAEGFGTGGPQRGGLGSGVIYRSDGYILTNNHVIEAANGVEVRLADGELLDAEVVGTDPLNDLAVLRVDRDDLPAINLRPSDEPLRVGETVVAIGSPFGLDASVTAGVLSAVDRELRLDEQQAGGGPLTIPSVLQTDAAINPGNSGGALVDAQGRLVGINTAILTRTGGSQGVGFAVSVDQAMNSADQLIEQGFVRHPLLGITGTDVTTEVADRFGLATTRGAVVDSVQDGTGAADSDLRPGDIIVSVDGDPLATMSQLVAEVRRRAPGDVVVLEIVRQDEELTIEVELSERPRDE
ncbi:MAG: trypsin-like peptidase domain-containing protein [Nitriliruptoraceae bacterium]|nr:trypsin-like peptidase domain-containing protein [Nitriliruptoraceae bacterium]